MRYLLLCLTLSLTAALGCADSTANSSGAQQPQGPSARSGMGPGGGRGGRGGMSRGGGRGRPAGKGPPGRSEAARRGPPPPEPRPLSPHETFEGMDIDEDGFLSEEEVPSRLWLYLRLHDTNHDEQLSRTEFDDVPR